MTRRVSFRGITVVLCMLWPSVVSAHAIHTTLTQAQVIRGVLTFTIRSFADDFSQSVARYAGHAAPRDSSVRADEVTRYVVSRVVISDARGQTIPLTPCGLRREGELYFSCFRAQLPRGGTGVRVTNGLLTELHADQVNIVQVLQDGARRTLLCTRTSPPAALIPET